MGTWKKKDKKTSNNLIEGGTPTLIGANSSFEGSFEGSESICIDGRVRGYIDCKEDVYINKNAYIEGDVTGKNIVVHGKVIGNIIAKDTLLIGEKGKIIGDVSTKIFCVEKGGVLHGKCSMEKQVEKLDMDTEKKGFFNKFSLLNSKRSGNLKSKLDNLEKSINNPSTIEKDLSPKIDEIDDVIEVKQDTDLSSNSVN